MNRVLKKENTENKTSVRYFEGLNLWMFAMIFVVNVFFQLGEVSSSLFLYIGIAVLLGSLIFVDKDDYIYIFVSLLSDIRVAMIFDVSVINIITFVYFFRTYVFENEYKREKDKRRMSKPVVMSGVFFIMYSLQYMFIGDQGIRMSLIAIKLMFFLLYMVDVFRGLTDKKTAEKRFMNIQVYYVAGALIAVFTSVLLNPKYSLDAARMSLSEDAGTNQLGILLAFCIVLVTMGMTKVKNYKEWTILAATALPLLYFCFATQSRTSILGMAVTFVSVVIFGYSQKKARLPIILMVIASVVVFIALIFFSEGTQFHENIMETIRRFTDPKGDDISNGRFDLWMRYFKILGSDMQLLFFGGPTGKFGGTQAHNMFIEIVSSNGLLGTIIIIWMYGAVFYEIRKSIVSLGKGKIRILSFLPLVVLFITGMVSHSLLNMEPTVSFCLGVAMIYLYGENEQDEESIAYSDDSEDELVTMSKRNTNINRLKRRYERKFRSF